ncbi:DNA replication licensing factor Mcm3-like [Oopsacas minuta]|uniref:DNA replication licensing factor Mcm3-like n=1 Tax=Oopsacas minuta TaxID=111878 RepID=A0AAV7JHJ4_9METZ|nr:DNA replication licensing factor Mcm3-like [Oopsacas minuta]
MDFEDLTFHAAHKEYLNFLDDKSTPRNGVYFEKVQNMIRYKRHRLIIDINDLRCFLPDRVRLLFSNAVPEIVAFQKALMEFIKIIDSTYFREIEKFFVGFDGCVRSQFLNPRLVNSYSLNKLICIEGIVTKISFVHPKIIRSVHYCPNTDKILERRYSDQFSFESTLVGTSYPTKDEDGNPLETEFGLSTYKDYQTITIQELPETSPPGQLPR